MKKPSYNRSKIRAEQCLKNMNTRRQFFGQIATIFATSSAPSILLPKLSDRFQFRANNATKVAVFKTRKIKVVWTCELEQDLMCFHGIDVDKEVQRIVAKEVQNQI